MTWTETTRPKYLRAGLRYASDLTDAEWLIVAPFMPERSGLGRPREVELRSVVNAILYILATGCQWRALPKEFPARSTVKDTSIVGATMARGTGSTPRWSSSLARW